MRLASVFLMLTALLSACGAPAPASGPTATPPPPEEAPTAQVIPAEASAVAPTATGGPGGSEGAPAPSLTPATVASAAAGAEPPPIAGTPVAGAPRILPAALYLRSSEPPQVYRVEPDAASYSQITFERQPVVELAAPAAAGGIFYLVGDPAAAERTLVALSGAGRRELLSGELSALAVSPDGLRAFVRIDNPEPGLIIGRDDSPAGVWATTPNGMRPSLVIADEPADGVYDPDAPAWQYSPIAVSPDGGRLAVYAFDRDGPAIPGGEVVIVGGEGEPVRGQTCCELPAWSVDGAALHAAGGGPGPDLRYGLFRTDAGTGAETAVLEADPDGDVPLVTGPRQLADGRLYAFVERVPSADVTWERLFRPALSRVGPGGEVTPLAPPVAAPIDVLWSADGAGVVVAALDEQGRGDQLFWQPADGRPATRIPFAGGDMAWAPAGAPLAAGECGAFSPLGYQAGAARPDPAVYDLQGRLRPLGFDAGAPDGLYGERTRAAVEAFQRSRGLPPAGDVDCATWQALLARP